MLALMAHSRAMAHSSGRVPPLAGVHSPDSPIWLGFERAAAQTDRPRDLRRADKLPQLDLEDERGILAALKQGGCLAGAPQSTAGGSFGWPSRDVLLQAPKE